MHPLRKAFIAGMSALHTALYKGSGGKVGHNFGGPTLLLTTTGRKTGQPRTKPLLYLPDGDKCIVVASYGGNPQHPAWWLNLVADPHATVQIGNQVQEVVAREATDEERERYWPQVLKLYSGYETYQKRTTRKIPLGVLEPAG